MTFRLLVMEPDATVMSTGAVDDAEAYLDSGALVWLDAITDSPETLDQLGERFGFVPAAIEDVLDIEQLPKFENYEEHLFVILHGLSFQGDRVDTIEIDCFILDNLFVTVRPKTSSGIEWLWNAVQEHPELVHEHADELLAQLAEVIGRRYLEVVAEFEARIDDIAEHALSADPEVLSNIQVLRREEITVRQMLRPQRLVLAQLRGVTAPVSEAARESLGDAYDVHNQVVESLGSARALLTDALDSYRGAAADRQAKATTVLAVYSAILLPLTLITGWYGMNINQLPGSESRWSWELLLGSMVMIAVGSFLAFAKAGFIRPPKLRRTAVFRGLASAAKAPVKPFTMLRRNRSSQPSSRPSRRS